MTLVQFLRTPSQIIFLNALPCFRSFDFLFKEGCGFEPRTSDFPARTYVNEDGVDVVGTVVALEGGDVRPEVVR